MFFLNDKYYDYGVTMPPPSSDERVSSWLRFTQWAIKLTRPETRIGDWLSQIAVTGSATLIVSFFTFYIADAFAEPRVLKAAVIVLSCLAFFVLRSRTWPQVAKSLHENETISLGKRLPIATTAERLAMNKTYPSSLVRAFTFGVCLVAIGLLLTLIGIAAGNFGSQYGGGLALMTGFIIATFAVMRGENIA